MELSDRLLKAMAAAVNKKVVGATIKYLQAAQVAIKIIARKMEEEPGYAENYPGIKAASESKEIGEVEKLWQEVYDAGNAEVEAVEAEKAA